jgi:hypothetical protein
LSPRNIDRHPKRSVCLQRSIDAPPRVRTVITVILSFGTPSGRQPNAETRPANVIFTSPGASLRRNATDMSVS